MANYYVDDKGNVTSNKDKKKKKPTYTVSLEGKVTKSTQEDIAPVKTTTTKKNDNKRTWFQKGAFDDGYQFGDVTKTILGTVADLGENLGSGIIGMGETMLDAGMMLSDSMYKTQLAQSGVMLTQEHHDTADQMRKDAMEFVKKDLYNEQEVAKKIIGAPLKSVGLDANASVLGEKSDSLAQSGGQLLATVGLSAVGVPWFLTTGATSFGAESENALNQGATYEEAVGSALISAGAEILTEKLSGGISFGGKTLDAGMTDILARNISSKGLRVMSKIGMDMAGEGAEEVVSQVFSNLGSALYKEENLGEILASEEAFEEYLESFIGGSVLGGVSSGINAGKSAKQGTDVLTGYTKNEQAVFDKVLENRIKAQEQDGKTLTSKEKKNIYEQVERAMERGELELEDIERTLGEDLYKEHDNLVKESEEFETLRNTKNGDLTDVQADRLKELKAKNEANPYSKLLEESKQKISQDIFNSIEKDSRLRESYYEDSRRRQDFAADLTKYDSKQAETIKRAMDSGILNNTRKTHDFVDMVAKVSAEKGVSFDFLNNKRLRESGFAIDGKKINGFKKGNTITVNMETRNNLNTVVGHEITHVLEGDPELYKALAEGVKAFGDAKGIYQEMYDTAFENYKNVYKDMSEEDYAKAIEKEVTADLVGEYIFSDIDFVRNLSTQNRNVFQKVYDEIKYFLKTVTAGSDAEKKLLKAKKIFEDVYRESNEITEYSDAEVQYSIREEAPPKETGVAYKVFYVKDGKLYPPMVANPDGAETPMGVWLNADVGTSAKPSKTGRPQVKAGGKGTQGGSGSLAFRPGWHLGDLPRASQFDRVNPETGKKELFPENFVWAEVEYAKDVDYQEEAMSYGYTENGKFRHAYAGLPRLPENGYYRYRTNPNPDTVPWVITGAMKVNRLLSDAEVNAILEENGVAPVHRQGGDVELDKFGFNNDGTVKYSLTDSDGNELSKGQQEYFKDSMIRDENGNLKVMYHGSPAQFTVFDKKKAKSSGYYGRGFYFSDSESHAGQYGSKYEVYLDIKNPIKDGTRSITREQLRNFVNEIAENEDYGIENYGYGATVDSVTDDVYGKDDFAMLMDLNATSIGDMVEAIQLFNEVNGTNYDGIIASTETVAFYPEQIKNTTNTNPTSDSDIRFSLSDSVEETKDLMAIHNLHSNELLKQIEMGGIPYPSIAVTNPSNIAHDDFGEISIILNKDSIDPKKNKYNHIYSADAYTPTFPSVRYEANREVANKFSEKVNELYDKIPDYYQRSISYFRDETNFNDRLNSDRGEQGLIERLYEDYGMKQVYLAETSEVVPIQINQTEVKMTDYEIEDSTHIIDRLGEEAVKKYKFALGFNAKEYRAKWYEKYGEQLKDSYAELLSKDLNVSHEEARTMIDNETPAFWVKLMRNALKYLENGGTTIKEETDIKKTNELIDEKVDNEKYKQWLNDHLTGIEGRKGIRNNKDMFTPSGKRRSFSQLYDDVTIDNVIKAMRNEDQSGQGALGTGNIQGASAQEFTSIAEVKANKNRLGKMSEEEHKEITKKINDDIFEIANRYSAGKDIIDAKKTICEAVAKYETRTGIAKYLKQYDYVYKYDDSIVDDVIELRDYIRSLPTPYFEAKPRRAVGLEEVAVYVIPNNADAKLKQALLDGGYSIAEYDPNVEGDRQRVLNSYEDLKFSLSDENQEIAPSPNGIYSKDVLLQSSETQENSIAPLDDFVDSNKMVQDNFVEDYAPLTETQANMRDDRTIEEHYFPDDIAPELEEYDGEFANHVKPSDPFYEKDIFEVGRDRKQKAYMYENPEVKPFFQQEARYMLGELDNSQKGEKFYNDQLYYDTNGEYGFFGTKRHTSEEIAYLLDTFGYTYKDIAKGLNAIIEDNGKENNAISKRIEFLLDERLRLGYKDFWFGDRVPPNQDYINLINEKQINEYNDEAFGNWVQNLSEEDIRYFTRQDEIAPTPQEYATVDSENIKETEAPLYNAKQRRGVVEGQLSMVEEESELDRKKRRINSRFEIDKEALKKERDNKYAEALKKLEDKGAYISKRANELYNELTSLRKGVKASKDLGYLLDVTGSWKDLKIALLNTRAKPLNPVNVNEHSSAESWVRETLIREYDSKLEDAFFEVEEEYDKQLEKLELEKQSKLADIEEPIEKPKTMKRSDLHSGIINNIKETFNKKGFDFDNVLKKAKNLSTFSTVDNTPQRVMEKALGYKEGQVLSDLTVNKVAQNETEGIKWLNSFTDRKKGLLKELSKQYNIKSGSKESAAAQMFAEGFYVNKDNEIIRYGERELAIDFPDAKVRENIKGLANDPRIREIYDNTLKMINESRTRNAYPEIPRLDNYFLHFRAMDDTFSKLGLPFNPNDIRAKDLPTDLNGVTADLKPGQPYFASAMHRTGQRTSFDLLGGLERYLTSAKNQIYHIDDIQTLRALRNYIADTYGQANGLENLDSLSEEEAQERIESVYSSHLSTFAKFLNEEANVLAGKTALIDRGLEGIIGRRALTFMNTLNRQVGSNMVGFSGSSALVNIDAIPRALAKTNKADFVKGFAQFTYNKIGSIFGRNDGFAEQSPVMIRRKGADRFYRTPYQKIGDAGYVVMGAIDNAATEIIARTKYNELLKKGMDSQQAHFETDKWVSRLMGDRSLGQMPQLFNSQTLGLITKFQLEVRNNLDSMFYDTVQEAKVSNEEVQNALAKNTRTAAKVTSTLVQLAVGQHLFGKAMESVVGYNPAFDIISVMMTALGFDDEEDSEDTALDNIEQGFLELMEDLPYTSTLTGGRIPIASALPIEELVTGKDEYGNDKSRLKTLGEVAPYYVLPAGYGQIKKTYQGLSMFDDDLPVSGSYTDSGNLRFPVEDTIGNRIKAGIFGQYANENAREYFDRGLSPLKEKQIKEYKDLDLPISEYWDYREGLKGKEKLEEKLDYIQDLDLPIAKKNIMANYNSTRDEEIDMSIYASVTGLEEYDEYIKYKEKIDELGFSSDQFSEYVGLRNSISDIKKKIEKKRDKTEDEDELAELSAQQKREITETILSSSLTDKQKAFLYDKYYQGEEKLNMAMDVGIDFETYITYAQTEFKADKNANGKTISGSAKAKKMAYIESLDLDYGQKLILHRMSYSSQKDKNAYNRDIVEYLDSREDITWDVMVTILEELDFKVYEDGRITW